MGPSSGRESRLVFSPSLQAYHAFPQQRNNASSMRQRRCWISQKSRPTSSHLLNRVWGVSMRSSNTTKYVSTESPTILLTCASQGCKDVEDKLGDLVLWLTKLKNSLATTSIDNNRDEAERREQLTRFLSHPYRSCQSNPTVCPRSLEDIDKQSQTLLDKGKVAKILDKGQDSAVVVKLVEELRQAILIYQVGIVPLRAVDHVELKRLG